MPRVWVSTKEEADALVKAKSETNWGIEVNKVNRANKKYTHGYIVFWGPAKKMKKRNPGAKQFTVTLSSGKKFQIIAANEKAALTVASRMFPGAKVNPGLKKWIKCSAVRIANGKVQIKK